MTHGGAMPGGLAFFVRPIMGLTPPLGECKDALGAFPRPGHDGAGFPLGSGSTLAEAERGFHGRDQDCRGRWTTDFAE